MRLIFQIYCLFSALFTLHVQANVTELNTNKLATPAINDFAFDTSNTFWLATQKGLFNYDAKYLFSGETPPFSSFSSQIIYQVASYKSWLNA